jgi:hypothetical protein
MRRPLTWPSYSEYPMPLTRNSPLMHLRVKDEDEYDHITVGAADLTDEELRDNENDVRSRLSRITDEENMRYERAVLFVINTEIGRRKAEKEQPPEAATTKEQTHG